MFFDFKTTGVPFEPYTPQHLAAVILFLALPLPLIFVFIRRGIRTRRNLLLLFQTIQILQSFA